MKHALTAVLSLAMFVTVMGCERGGEAGKSHGHDHGDGDDHQGGASDGVIARITVSPLSTRERPVITVS